MADSAEGRAKRQSWIAEVLGGRGHGAEARGTEAVPGRGSQPCRSADQMKERGCDWGAAFPSNKGKFQTGLSSLLKVHILAPRCLSVAVDVFGVSSLFCMKGGGRQVAKQGKIRKCGGEGSRRGKIPHITSHAWRVHAGAHS